MPIERRPFHLCATVLFMALASQVQADFQEAALAYQRRDFPTVAKELRPLGEAGDPVAQYLLASALANAKSPALDLAAAEAWLTQSAGQGNIAAMRDLGQLHLYYKKPGDRAAAERWLRAGADRGDVQSQHLPGVIYLDAQGAERKPAEACKWLLLASQRGHLLSAVMLRLDRSPFSAQERQAGERLAAEWIPIC